MKLISDAHKPEDTLTVALRWEHEGDGDFTPTIYYDHIAVAYIRSDNGRIYPIDLETGPYIGGDESASVKYLEDKGVELVIAREKASDDGRGVFVNFQVRMENA